MEDPIKIKANSRQELIAQLHELAPWSDGEPSPITGSRSEAMTKLSNINPLGYGKTRNYGNGHISYLSPFIHHGLLSLAEVRDHALACSDQPEHAAKFIQELGWREFWQRCAWQHPEWIWSDIESYKTGYSANDYSDRLSDDICNAATGTACIDACIKELIETGYLHNHARMYLASYIVHFRRIKWQAGARWFLQHLLDGDEASNNLSWQWIASTFSQKPYIFNLENVDKYFSGLVDTSPENNAELNYSYEELGQRLFPLMESAHV